LFVVSELEWNADDADWADLHRVTVLVDGKFNRTLKTQIEMIYADILPAKH
jgi:hypothetical protein